MPPNMWRSLLHRDPRTELGTGLYKILWHTNPCRQSMRVGVNVYIIIDTYSFEEFTQLWIQFFINLVQIAILKWGENLCSVTNSNSALTWYKYPCYTHFNMGEPQLCIDSLYKYRLSHGEERIELYTSPP